MQLHQKERSEASRSNEWVTDQELVDKLGTEKNLNLKLDVACSFDNKKCEYFITKEIDSLNCEWLIDGQKYDVFCNPPNEYTQEYIAKADEQWQKHNLNILMLIPINATVTKNGRKYIWDNPLVELYPVLPTPKFSHNGEKWESARNRYCSVVWRKQ